MLGICKGALDVAMKSSLAHANIDSEERQRRAKDFFSQSIEDLRLAEMCMEIEATQMLTYNAALRRDWNGEEENLPKESLALLATLHACKTAQKVTSTCVDLLGKNGFLRDFLVEKFYRDSKTASLISLDRRSGVYRQYKDLSKMIKTRYEQSRLPLE
ncbi:acyl- dehydrogenase [Cystoisospora suis]|uniref:Acyl-dehydrogenase n=1 Tax=Cystoisospora suis TaxID=483139 RepID=A0A2C6KV49_9APIC|nr:acyl- dehydrogenase [Cystoisospora suis]